MKTAKKQAIAYSFLWLTFLIVCLTETINPSDLFEYIGARNEESMIIMILGHLLCLIFLLIKKLPQRVMSALYTVFHVVFISGMQFMGYNAPQPWITVILLGFLLYFVFILKKSTS